MEWRSSQEAMSSKTVRFSVATISRMHVEGDEEDQSDDRAQGSTLMYLIPRFERAASGMLVTCP